MHENTITTKILLCRSRNSQQIIIKRERVIKIEKLTSSRPKWKSPAFTIAQQSYAVSQSVFFKVILRRSTKTRSFNSPSASIGFSVQTILSLNHRIDSCGGRPGAHSPIGSQRAARAWAPRAAFRRRAAGGRPARRPTPTVLRSNRAGRVPSLRTVLETGEFGVYEKGRRPNSGVNFRV